MKVLVADDDALIRRLLMALLNKLGHQVEVAENGQAAWKALDTETPPALAILDWVMPGLDGVEVCRRLRASPRKTRTYVLLLSAKAEKQEVITGLDAGADDYLVKPFDPMSLLARLRVAQRIITYQHKLQQNIEEMEELLQRHNLLGEMFGKQSRHMEASAGNAGRSVSTGVAPDKWIPSVVSNERLSEIFAASFAAVGLGGAGVVTAETITQSEGATFTAWEPLVFIKQGVWMDLLFEADETSVVAMFEFLLGRIPVSEREMLDFLAETFNLICTAVKTALGESNISALVPIISRSIRTSALTVQPPSSSSVTQHCVRLPNIRGSITVIRQSAPVLHKSLGALHPFDIMAENLPSPGDPNVFLLNQGVILSERYIEKLTAVARSAQVDLRVPVILLSRLAEFFCLGRIGS